MKISRLLTTAVIGAALVGLTACSPASDPQPTGSGDDQRSAEPTELSIVTLGILSDATLQIAEEQGFFGEENLTVKTSIVANPPAALAAVQGGQADIGFSTSTVFMNARAQSIPVQIVAAAAGFPDDVDEAELAQYDDSGIYVDPASGIESIADLEGRIVALGGARNGQLEIATSYALQEAGVEPASVEWISLDLTSALESVKNGTADAAVLVKPFTLKAEDAGMQLLLAPQPTYFGPGAINFWVTSEAATQNKTDAISAFQRAIDKANAYANDHLEEAMQIGLDTAGLDVPLERAGRFYWPTTVREEDLERVNERMFALGFLEQPVDLDGAVLPR